MVADLTLNRPLVMPIAARLRQGGNLLGRVARGVGGAARAVAGRAAAALGIGRSRGT